MAPRYDETATLQVIQEDDVTESTQMEKIPGENCEAENADPILSVSTNFCSDIFGGLFGKKKKCNHCKQKLLNSDERLKEMNGETKIYYHPECKKEREARMEQKVELHNDLMAFFEVKAEMAREQELARMAKIRADKEAAEARKRDALDRERALELEQPAARSNEDIEPEKKGFFKKLFSGCRNNKAVEEQPGVGNMEEI